MLGKPTTVTRCSIRHNSDYYCWYFERRYWNLLHLQLLVAFLQLFPARILIHILLGPLHHILL